MGAGQRLWTRAFVLVWLASLLYQVGFQLPWAGLLLFAGERGADAAQLGLLTGLFALTALLGRPFVGPLLDTGRKRLVLAGGALIFVACAIGYALAGSVAVLLGLRLINGFGHAAGQTANQALATESAPPARRGEALSMQLLTLALALGLGPAVGVAIAGVGGYPAMFLVAGFCSLGAAIVILRAPEPPLPAVASRRRYFHPAALRPGLIMLALMLAFGAVVGLAPVHAANGGLANSGLIFLPYALGTAAVQLVGGRLSDRRGRGFVILPGLALSTLGIVWLALAGGWALLAAAALFGIGVGLAQPNIIALAADHAPPGERGSAIATVGMFLEGGISAGATLAGLIGQSAGLTTAFLMLGTLPALALVALAATPWGARTLVGRAGAAPPVG